MKKIAFIFLIIGLPVMAMAQNTRTPLTSSKIDTLSTPVLSLKDIQQFVSQQFGTPQAPSQLPGSFMEVLSKYVTKDVYDKIVTPAVWNALLPALSQLYAEKLKEILTNPKTNQ